MKTSEIGMTELCDTCRIDIDYLSDEDSRYLEVAKYAAIGYVASYTGLSLDEMDAHEDITIAVLALVSDMFDNRGMSADKSGVSRVVEGILGMHCTNLLG